MPKPHEEEMALDFFSMEERIRVKIDRSQECWLWSAYKDSAGYPVIRMGRNIKKAHRVVWEQLVGPIKWGLELDHLCKIRHCVNPAHLEPVTPQENSIRAKASITHCPHGHKYTLENTILRRPKDRPGTHRVCKHCWGH